MQGPVPPKPKPKRSPRAPDPPGGLPLDEREYVEARVLLADWQLERFLDFCEKELKQLPDLSHVPEGLDGYREFFELLAARKEKALRSRASPEKMN